MLTTEGRRIVVIGGGERGASMAAALLASGAGLVTLVGSGALERLGALGIADRIDLVPRAYVRGDLAGALATVCLEGGETAAAIAAEAETARCLVLVIGRPDLSTFRFAEGFLPSTFEE